MIIQTHAAWPIASAPYAAAYVHVAAGSMSVAVHSAESVYYAGAVHIRSDDRKEVAYQARRGRHPRGKASAWYKDRADGFENTGGGRDVVEERSSSAPSKDKNSRRSARSSFLGKGWEGYCIN